MYQNHPLISAFTPLIRAISKRKSMISKKIRAKGVEILDLYHGEMRYLMAAEARAALQKETALILAGKACYMEEDGGLFNKSQPQILRELAAQKLYPQLLNADLDLDAGEVIVSPYSSIVMLETALMTIARPNGVVLCPKGFYKSNALHIEKFGLTICCFEIEEDGRIDIDSMKAAIEFFRHRLCGVLLTMPGNPLEVEYTQKELNAIGKVLATAGVKTIVDATFTGINVHHKPLAAVEVQDEFGNLHLLHNQTLTITGISKGHHACGPYKIGVATSGDASWLTAIKSKLIVSFQRETTLLAKAVIEHTSLSYLLNNEQDMIQEQQTVKQRIDEVNRIFGADSLQYFGEGKYGPFLLITFRDDILEKAELEDGWQLADMLLATVGINCVAGPRMAFSHPCVRINVNAPRIRDRKNPALVDEIFVRLKQFISEIVYNGLTYRTALEHIGVSKTIGIATFQTIEVPTPNIVLN